MPHEPHQVILYPALARPLSPGRWQAVFRALVFRPCTDSIRRRLLIRAIARAAGVSHRPVARERLRRALAPFLVDNLPRRRVVVEIAGRRITLGPTGASGRVEGSITFDHARTDPARTLPAVATSDDARCTSVVHLIADQGLSVIADIDDTIKRSCVPDKRELLRNTFLRPYTPIEPVCAMLRALAQRTASQSTSAGSVGAHYVSASPWQLFDPLQRFIRRAQLPEGSFHLKAFRVKDRSRFDLLAPPDAFKLAAIRPLISAWPRRTFVLVGDSAERDPEIFTAIAREHPEVDVRVVIRQCPDHELRGRRLSSTLHAVPTGRWTLAEDGEAIEPQAIGLG